MTSYLCYAFYKPNKLSIGFQFLKSLRQFVDPRKILYIGQHGVQLRHDGITGYELRIEPFRCVEFCLDFLHPFFRRRQVQNGCFLFVLVVHERQADHIGDFPLRLMLRQRLQFLRADNIAVRGECARLAFTHLFADFGVIQESIGAVRQSIQILSKAVFYIKFPQFFVGMDICKHMAMICVGRQHHQLRYSNDAAVLLHMLVDLHLQESFQRRFLIAIQHGKLLRQGIELEDRHALVQMGREVVKTVEFIHLPVDVARHLRVDLLESVHHFVLARKHSRNR